MADEVEKLNPLENYVIRGSFGMEGPVRKLSDISNELGFSRQYIYKVKHSALKKLKESKQLNRLYAENL